MSAPRLAIVGAGVAGAVAAECGQEYGLDVFLFDRFEIPDSDSGITTFADSPVWGLFPGWQVAASRGERPVVVDADAILLANGAIDRAVAFSGSTLPGVMTASGLARVIDRWRLLPGRRFVVVGVGEDARTITHSIVESGGEVVLQVEPASAGSLVAHGDQGVEQVTLGGTMVEADIVVMAAGMLPDVTLPGMAECDLTFDDAGGYWQVWRDDQLRTSAERVWAAGSVGGEFSREVAQAEGRLAAASIAHALGTMSDVEFAAVRARADLKGAIAVGLDKRIRQPWRPDDRIVAMEKSAHE